MPWRPRMMPPVGKSGPGMIRISSSMPSAGSSIKRDGGIDHLAQIVRRDIGRHADRDAAGAVGQEIGEARRQYCRLALGIVIVRLEVDRVLVEILEQRIGDLGEPHLGVAHGRRRIAVDRAEIALAVDQRQAHGKVLRHAHQRVVDRLVPVRMVFADDVADDARRFAIRLVPFVAVLVHRIEDAPVHGLEAVARVRQCPRHDHAHGVVKVGALHLLRDRDRTDIGRIPVPRRHFIVIGQRKFPARLVPDGLADSFAPRHPQNVPATT